MKPAKPGMEINSKPEELDVGTKIRQIEIELVALKKEKAKEKISQLQKELANLKEERETLFSQWKHEKEQVEQVQVHKENLERLKQEAERAEREGDFAKAAEIRYGKIGREDDALTTLQQQLECSKSDVALIKEEVGYEDIAEVIVKVDRHSCQ